MVPVAHQRVVFLLKLPDVRFHLGNFRVQLGKRRLFHGVIQFFLGGSGHRKLPGNRIYSKPQTVVRSIQCGNNPLRLGLFRNGQFLLHGKFFQPFQLGKVCLFQRIVAGLNDVQRFRELLLRFGQSNDPPVGGVHSQTYVSVPDLQLFKQ